MDLFDWMFIISGFIFFVSMISAILLMANNKMDTVKIFGVILAILMVPILAILIDSIVMSKDIRFVIFSLLILIYLMAELLLDRVFKIDFRSKPSTHVPYIIIEWAAAFSFLFGVIRLDATIGWIIAIFFWTFIVALVYYIIKRRKIVAATTAAPSV
ncbi:MAG: hypothetical protein HWN80_20105 [Candidatus Lokiarchaeota archaeon]|nr:hypothetical protein [Candidatus Lokiarchaeota archaeon]